MIFALVDLRHREAMMSVEVEAASPLERYVPRIATDWSDDAPDKSWQEFDATLCFVDISGFTNLSEKFARRGRIGAEELTGVLNWWLAPDAACDGILASG
jgi:hypothetical protein